MNLWIVDNDIPLNKCKDSQIKTGMLPAGREALAGMVEYDMTVWGADSPLLDLCKALLKVEDIELLCFQHPANAEAHMDRSTQRPDLLLYDWDFGDNGDSPARLSALYKKSFFVTQIFSNKDKDAILREIQANSQLGPIQPLLLKFKSKGTDKIGDIVNEAKGLLKKNVGANLAVQIRKTTTAAVEDTLRELGCLPLEHALEVLGRKEGEPDIADIASVFASGIIAALQQGEQSGEEKKPYEKDAAIESIVSRIRGAIETNDEILDILRKVMSPSGKVKLDKSHRDAIQRFVSFQMYGHPTDQFVRQGDIARMLNNGEADGDNLYLILNAACDLERFPSKTRDVLTVLRLHPLKENAGLSLIGRGGNVFDGMGDSILKYYKKARSSQASGGTIVLPSMFTVSASGEINYIDYVGIAQEIMSIRINPGPAGTEKHRLTYSMLAFEGDKKLQKVCSINFSFLPAILGTIAGAIAGYGVPTLPESEQVRISDLRKKDA